MSNPQDIDRQVWQFMQHGKIREAAEACQQLNSDSPDFAPGWYTASHLALAMGQPQAAVGAINRALQSQPDKLEWTLQHIETLIAVGDVPQAKFIAAQTMTRTFSTGALAAMLGRSLERLAMFTEARDQYRLAAKLEPASGDHLLSLAGAEMGLGNAEAVDAALEQCLQLAPDNVEAHVLRSQLSIQTPDDNHIELLEAAIGRATTRPQDQVRLGFALSKELGDIGEYDKSFDRLAAASRMRRSRMQYEFENELLAMQKLRSLYDKELLDGHFGGFSSDKPIFVVGLPRTGNSLVERALASHSAVESAGDLRVFANELMRQCQLAAGENNLTAETALERSTTIDFTALGEQYLISLQAGRPAGLRIVDRLAMNFLYLGPIHMALPQAKIIVLERDPVDTCFTLYKTLFEGLYPFTYDLTEVAKYFVEYQRLMQHWQSTIGDSIHVVNYEALVNNPEVNVASLLEFCGLPVEEVCFDLFGSTATPEIAAESQTRQQYFETSIGCWRPYEKHLKPVLDILREANLAG